jgi:hypothetical protein
VDGVLKKKTNKIFKDRIMTNKCSIIILIALLLLTACSRKEPVRWVKYENNPVLGGGDLGTIFDISALKEDEVYKMYNSWRPKGSLALSVSASLLPGRAARFPVKTDNKFTN